MTATAPTTQLDLSTLADLELTDEQAAAATNIPRGMIRRLYADGLLEGLVYDTSSSGKRYLRVKASNLDAMAKRVREVKQRQRTVRQSNAEILLVKLDTVARAIQFIADQGPAGVSEDIRFLLRSGGFDTTVVAPGDDN